MRLKKCTTKEGIKISPKFCQSDWQNLDLDRNNSEDWKKAVEIFRDRIEGRFFNQIKVMDENPDREVGCFSGFAIMALTCLLIETIEQFWKGNIETSRKKSTSQTNGSNHVIENNRISDDALAFHSFFKRSSVFKNFFDTEQKSNVFYTKIRCGLLHQGQTKGTSLIHIRHEEPILKWIDANNPEKGLSIHRRKFLNEVREVYEAYITFIEAADLNTRKKSLKKKMDYIVKMK